MVVKVFNFKSIIMNNMENKIFRAIDRILWTDWDPIGVNDLSMCRDEYRTYVPGIYQLKVGGSDEETIATRLLTISVEEMEVRLSMKHCRKVAEKILSV